jgi:hypothetical protein
MRDSYQRQIQQRTNRLIGRHALKEEDNAEQRRRLQATTAQYLTLLTAELLAQLGRRGRDLET